MFRYSSHLSDTEELVIFAVCLGSPLLLALASRHHRTETPPEASL